ncbi:MAG TPA: DUF4102 domain-containing protein, partial [Chromatiaceae bacterium]|nr:DUF4102 domain-containing protein [Chromatiaceae bacterium]
MSKLTDARCRNAKPSSKDQWLSDGSGLYLRIRPGGSKTWVVRAKRGGKSTVTTLEPYTDMSLKEARLEAATIAVEKKITNTTVARLIAQYTDDVICHHKRPVMATGYMDRAIRPALGTMRVRDVRRTDVVCVIQGYISNGRRTADQLRSQLRSLFSYAVELGYIEHNPAA